MAARGSKLGRMLEFFKSGDIEEVRFVFARAKVIIGEREGPPYPEKRTRRSKAQLAADRGKDAHTAMAAQA